MRTLFSSCPGPQKGSGGRGSSLRGLLADRHTRSGEVLAVRGNEGVTVERDEGP